MTVISYSAPLHFLLYPVSLVKDTNFPASHNEATNQLCEDSMIGHI